MTSVPPGESTSVEMPMSLPSNRTAMASERMSSSLSVCTTRRASRGRYLP
jgi:hypothetical protein